MAGVPQAPPKPTYISSTDTAITVQLYKSTHMNGAPITSYEVWRDIGDNDSSGLTTQELSYDGTSMQFTVNGLTAGSIYKIASLCTNSEGDSALSEYVLIGATELPDPPATLYKDTLLSNKTALTISWDESPQTSLPIIGYILEVADYGSKNF